MKEIPLTRGYVALVDDEDYLRFGHLKWTALVYKSGIVRAYRTQNRSTVYLHRLIVDAGLGEEVDHKNLNTLDNQKENLRLCTSGQNKANCGPRKRNKTGFKGVFGPYGKLFYAKIQVQRESIGLGFYALAEDAARAYDSAALKHFGPFARLNFPK